ncbi:DUF3570 domain-containing protein [Sphingobacteriales bacterium CHB3]|nr:DUF3570 domain-containing protein [Sphingobacteriales bacterium CHB3]
MRRYIKPISVCTLLSFLPWLTGYAAGEREGLGFTTYYFSDSGDNSVVTTSFKLAKKLLENTLFLIDIELDQVTVPAVTAVTGATRPQRRKNEPFEKNRGQIIVGVQQGLGDNASFAGNFYRSQEIDYVSNAFVGIFSHDLNDKNTTVTLRGQYNADLVGKILDDGDIVNQRKKTYNGSFNLSQILSPNTVMDVSYDFVLHKGFQSDPYRQVRVLDGTGASITVDELHPNSRTRHAAAMKLSQFIAPIKASVIGSYRYYFDSWKVKSHTGEVKFNKYILNDLVFGVDFRYYTQTAAYFYKDRYDGNQYQAGGLRTADYKLKEFSSNNFGFTLTYLLRGLAKSNPDMQFLQDSAIELQYFRYFNSLDFSADIIQASITFSI